MSSNNLSIEQNSTDASAAATNGLNELRTLEAALTGVNSVLAREGEELNERDLEQLLREIDAADNVADGVESKLDELLKKLGGMLEGLEGTGEQEKKEARLEDQDENRTLEKS